ncbi:hypothetical protein QBC47DRAFT_384905 [Echria macrotheca]|uniref:MARVEL domain-containing protein n=1 Tax=Echria macrotheca TaxID=438768 RepID=A0AAJ0FB37_9PEZI|nr:hypothetical protein QBC47DRAFT_384905 [Echria macrotheca]
MKFKLPEKGREPSSSPLLMAIKLFLRTIQLLCSVVILSIYSYFLAALGNHSLPIPTSVRAVEGISGFAILYTVVCIVVLCLFPRAAASRPLSSLAVMVLDVAFASAFIYVASANGGASGGCSGNVNTPFGSGDAQSGKMDRGGDGFTSLPASLGQACRLQAACLGAGVIAIFFFVFSPLAEVALIRHNRHQRRLGNPAPLAPSTVLPGDPEPKRGWLSRLFGRRGKKADAGVVDENVLPEHAHPEEMRTSYATDQTRVDDLHGAPPPTTTTTYYKYDSLPDPYQTRYQPQQHHQGYQRDGLLRHDGLEEEEDIGVVHGGIGTGTGNGSMSRIGNEPRWDEVPLARYPPANYRYTDGVYDRV